MESEAIGGRRRAEDVRDFETSCVPRAERPLKNRSRRRRLSQRELCGPADLKQAEDTVPVVPGSNTAAVPIWLWSMHVAYKERHEHEVLTALVEHYSDLAASRARRLWREGEPIEDLTQIAMEALVRALHRFDPLRGIPFPALAVPTIEGAIKRHYRDRGYGLRLPRRIHDSLGAVRWAAEHLESELRRDPTVQEVAAFLDLPVEVVLDVEEALHARRLKTFELAADDPVAAGATRALEGAEDHAMLMRALAVLGEREREIVYLYFFEDQSQSVIAQRYGVSQMQVSRWLANILGRVRAQLVW